MSCDMKIKTEQRSKFFTFIAFITAGIATLSIVFIIITGGLSLFLFPTVADAKNFGVYGSIYPIEEEDLLVFIQNRLKTLEKTGELKKLEQKFVQNSIHQIQRPNPVIGLTTTNTPKTFFIDPSFYLTRDIRDSNGRIILFEGTKFNPLDHITLHSVLLFFDADDPKQLVWAKDQSEQISKEQKKQEDQPITSIKYILVKGEIARAVKSLGDTVYFDQEGIISRKLKLKHIPCLVKQSDHQLKVQEFSIDSLNKNYLPSNTNGVNKAVNNTDEGRRGI